MTATAEQTLAELAHRWEEALAQVRPVDVRRAEDILTDRLLAAETAATHLAARRDQLRLVRQAKHVVDLMQGLLTRIEALRGEWDAMRKYSADGLDDLCEELAGAFAIDPSEGLRRWLRELTQALSMAEGHAAARIAALDLGLEGDKLADARDLAERVRAWSDGDLDVGLGVARDLADGTICAQFGLRDTRIQVRGHRIVAWLSYEIYSDPDRARDHLDTAIRLRPSSGRARSERAALFLRLDEVERATSDAHRAVEARPDGATGHLVLGVCAERAHDFAAADELYRTGLQRMSPFELATAYRRVSLLEPTGRMLLRVGERLIDLHRPEPALTLLDEALRRGIADPRPYSDVDAHRLRSVALARLDRPSEAAIASLLAGKRHYWQDEIRDATHALERARELDDSLAEVGWWLAEALVSLSSQTVQAGAVDLERVERARTVWDETRERFGLPASENSWAYMTRARIAEDLAYARATDEHDAWWEALLYAERSIVHELVDATFADGGRWASAAGYLRAVGLHELALECADRADALGISTYAALTDRVALLGSVGRFAELEAVTARIEAAYGPTGWLGCVRGWVAYHDERFEEALGRLARVPRAHDDYPAQWLHGLAALCHLGLGDADGARRAYAELRAADPVEGADWCELAVACAALGKIGEARDAIRSAEADAATPRTDVYAAAAFVELADGKSDEGAAQLERAIRHVTSIQHLDEVLRELNLRLLLVPEPDAARQRLAAAVEQALATRRRELEEHPATADSSLEDALAEYGAEAPGGDAHTALRAVKARRLLQRGKCLEAAEQYESLIESPFDREALLGLRRALEEASHAVSKRGDVAAVREIQDRLQSHGWVEPSGVALAVSAALVQAGDAGEALAELERALTVADEPLAQRALHKRVADVAMALRDPALADRHLAAAAALAEGELAEVARLDVRRAIANGLTGRFSAAADHMRAAKEAWRRAGAFDPNASLRQEIMVAVGEVAPALTRALRDALLAALRAVLAEPSSPALEIPREVDTAVAEEAEPAPLPPQT